MTYRIRDRDLKRDGSPFTKADLERLLERFRRTGNVTAARGEVVDSPANHVGHRSIRDEQLRLIAESLETARPTLRKVV